VLAIVFCEAAPVRADLTIEQKARAERLISLFENGITQVQYGYIEALGDGRGYTFGRAGFTTATGDALLLVEEYTKQRPENPLGRYLPRLRKLANRGSGSVSGLEGFVAAYQSAVRDSLFIALQDQLQDDLYYYPAMRIARELGLRSALAKAVIYDTIIQHGGGSDPDSLEAIIARTERIFSGSPAQGVVGEAKFIYTFLRIRRAVLSMPDNAESAGVWAESTGRVDALMQMMHRGYWNLDRPIRIQTRDYDEIVN